MTEEQKIDTKTMNLWQKISAIQGEVGWVEKSGRNEMQKYNYVAAVDVFDRVRTLCVKYGVVIEPKMTGKLVQLTYGAGKTTQAWEGLGVFLVRNSDNPSEFYEASVPGYAFDSGDKAAWKGHTGVLKYLCISLFLIPTGDDPEADTETDNLSPETSKSPKVTKKANPISASLGYRYAIPQSKEAALNYAKALTNSSSLKSEGSEFDEASGEAWFLFSSDKEITKLANYKAK